MNDVELLAGMAKYAVGAGAGGFSDDATYERASTLALMLDVAAGDPESVVVIASGSTAALLRYLVRVEVRKARRARRNAEIHWSTTGGPYDAPSSPFDPSDHDARVAALEQLYRQLGDDPARIHMAGAHRDRP